MRTSPLPVHQRLANRLLAPFGILPFAFVNVCDLEGSGEREQVFDTIYDENYWTRGESASGDGSDLGRTAGYRAALTQFLRENNVSSFFDAPCGDLHWMRLVLADHPMSYIGGDISEGALRLARSHTQGLDLRRFDICQDPFPDAEIWQCRDALFHLSFEDCWKALANAAKSNFRYALLTNHRARYLRNLDIETGSWRHLDLTRAPFHFPEPVAYLPDGGPGEFPRAVGVWPIEAIREVVSARAPSPR